MQRRALGSIALVLLVFGSLSTFTDIIDSDDAVLGGVALRTGLILGAFWLVMPRARTVPRAVWAGMAVFAAVLALRPRLVLVGIAGAFIVMVVVAVAQRRAGAQ
jgi:hypothetical protein